MFGRSAEISVLCVLVCLALTACASSPHPAVAPPAGGSESVATGGAAAGSEESRATAGTGIAGAGNGSAHGSAQSAQIAGGETNGESSGAALSSGTERTGAGAGSREGAGQNSASDGGVSSNDATLTAPGGGAAAESEGAALTATQVNRELFAQGQPGAEPVNDNGLAVYVQRAPAVSRLPEVFAVFAAVPSRTQADVATLSDFGRLFKADVQPVRFMLKVFSERQGHLQPEHTYPLGSYFVYESERVVPIHSGSTLPFAVATTFQTEDGSDDQWVIFYDGGASQFSLQETLSRSTITEDIDGNGYLDVIYRERGIEEGTGYETFLMWYRWNGTQFVQYRTTNIVRNLRSYLQSATDSLQSGNLTGFLQIALSAAALATLRKNGADDMMVFNRIFHVVPSTSDNPNPPLASISDIVKVVFPNIFENPFSLSDSAGYSFPLSVRFVTSDDINHLYDARVTMHRNPFESPQFDFEAYADAGSPQTGLH